MTKTWNAEELRVYGAVAEDAARQAGAVLMEYVGKFHVKEKGRADLVTEADVAAQAKVKELVLNAFPEHALLGEEVMPGADAHRAAAGRFRWIVDPLDGTTNYVHGMPHFCVSLALECGGELLAAAIYAPPVEECYTAVLGGGAFLNGRPIHVTTAREPEESLVGVGFPPAAGYDAPDVIGFMNILNACQAIRRTGSTAMNMAYVAAGRFDASWNFYTNPWDMAAGALLVTEAGGVLTDITGAAFCVDGHSYFVTATRELHEKFDALLRGDGFRKWKNKEIKK